MKTYKLEIRLDNGINRNFETDSYLEVYNFWLAHKELNNLSATNFYLLDINGDYNLMDNVGTYIKKAMEPFVIENYDMFLNYLDKKFKI